jgi:hypothetical protein
MTSSRAETASAIRPGSTHDCRLWTPSFPILLVYVKKRSLSRGRYAVAVFVAEVRLVTVRRREVVSMVLRKAGVANMIYGQDGAQ